jgi:hypothetical protein
MQKTIKTIGIAACAIALVGLSACQQANTNTSAYCPGRIMATWKVDTTTYQCNSKTTSYNAGHSFSLILYVCVPVGAAAKSIEFDIPHDLQLGSYPLRWKPMHSWPLGSYGGADYLVNNVGSYYTDSTTHTGMLTITSLNTMARVYSGTFSFDAVNDAGTDVVHINQGVLTDIDY